jgi:uncharacterized protein YdaU (DUF1376 family)
MSKDLGPHMPLYLDRFLGGTMSFEAHEVGAYILLIAHQWQHGSIENDQRMIERVARCEYGKMRRVLAKFADQGDGTIANPVCAKVRADRDEWIKTQIERGKRGADVRWQRGQADSQRHSGGHSGGHSQRHSSGNGHTDTDTDTNIRIPKPTTTTSEGGGGFELSKTAKTPEIIDALMRLRPEYGRVNRTAWENVFKQAGAKPEHYAEAANAFIQADANRYEPYASPARYFAGIVKRTLESHGVETETHEEKIERIRRGK